MTTIHSLRAGLLALALALSGCALPDAPATTAPPGATDNLTPSGVRVHGLVPDRRTPKPAISLADTSGAPYDFKARTEGKVAFLFFGFTNCSDVCPTAMADLAVALQDLPAAEQQRVEVVFVTTDPARDTPPVLREWLDLFDGRLAVPFTGLTGTVAEVEAAQAAAGLRVAEIDGSGAGGHSHAGGVTEDHPHEGDDGGAGGGYDVGHSSAVLAYGTAGVQSVIYPAGTSADDYAADLTVLTAEQPQSGDTQTGGTQ